MKKIFVASLMLAATYFVINIGVKYPTYSSVIPSNHITLSKYCINNFENSTLRVNNASSSNVVKVTAEEESVSQKDLVEDSLFGKMDISKKEVKRNMTGEDKVYVMLLSYQRSGSSYTGNLFNRNPAVFYVYEPLDALHSSLYGIPPGWSVPSDITGNKDGSVRKQPDYEIKASADVMSNLFECNFNDFPTEVLISQFWNQFGYEQVNVLSFTKCLQLQKVNVGKCQSLYLEKICADRLALSQEKEQRCYNLLHSSSKTDLAIRAKYTQCLLSETERAKECFPMLQKRCELSPVRAVKTVRATMEVVNVLLDRHPNLKIIHLIRDPRPVLLSRMYHESYRAVMSNKSMVTEAIFMCNIVNRDLQQRKELERKYQGRITEIIYEEFATHPIEKAQDVYKFLNLPFADNVRQWFGKHSHKAEKILHSWEKKMTKNDKSQIDEICKDVLNYGQKIWN